MKIKLLEERVASTNGKDVVNLGSRSLLIEADSDCLRIEGENASYLLKGSFYYARFGGGVETFANKDMRQQLRRVLDVYGPEEFSEIVEGEYLGVAIDRSSSRVSLFADRFNRRPLFYSNQAGRFAAGDRLPEVLKELDNVGYDQRSLYSYFLLGYAPGRETFYRGVSKLGADEVLIITADGVAKSITRRPKAIRDYDSSDIDRYDQIIRNSVATRASRSSNIVMNSGGWDSTSLVYLLGEACGRRNLQSIVFDVHLRDGQSFNVYEVDKVRRISDYYGIKSDTCVIDYGRNETVDVWERNTAALRDSHTYFWVHHMKLGEQIAGIAAKDAAVFSGEASDSIHNFGYSQWVSVNYEGMALREIADKGKSYLYGPTFFAKIKDGSYAQDKVFQFFKSYYGEGRFARLEGVGGADLLQQYFEAFVLSYPRVPFAKWQSESLVSSKAASEFRALVGANYFNDAVQNASSSNLYYHLLQLYRLFHFQSAQIAVSQVALASHGLSCRMPFLDMQMVDYMSSMPENWGRGLELRTTKYPLRYLASEKWDMPLHILDEPGPHSYIAENDKKWTYSGGQWDIYCEILFDSVFSDYFKSRFSSFRVEDYFDPTVFNVPFLKGVLKDYADGKQDIPNHGVLFKLALLATIGLAA